MAPLRFTGSVNRPSHANIVPSKLLGVGANLSTCTLCLTGSILLYERTFVKYIYRSPWPGQHFCSNPDRRIRIRFRSFPWANSRISLASEGMESMMESQISAARPVLYMDPTEPHNSRWDCLIFIDRLRASRTYCMTVHDSHPEPSPHHQGSGKEEDRYGDARGQYP